MPSEHDYGWIECAVCSGTGDYLVIDRYGSERGEIRCPECYGSGEVMNVPVERRKAGETRDG